MEKEINKYKAILYLVKEIYETTFDYSLIWETFPEYKISVCVRSNYPNTIKENYDNKFIFRSNYLEYYWYNYGKTLLLCVSIQYEEEENNKKIKE